MNAFSLDDLSAGERAFLNQIAIPLNDTIDEHNNGEYGNQGYKSGVDRHGEDLTASSSKCASNKKFKELIASR